MAAATGIGDRLLPTMLRWSVNQRTSRFVCLLTAALITIVGLLCGQSWAAPIATLFFWPYVTAVVFVGLAAACAILGRPAPSLPLGGEQLRGRPLVLLVVCVVLATALRENG